MTITQQELRSLLRYEPETGKFIWLINASTRAKAGCVAGSIRKRDGYVVVRIKGQGYSAHRLAWLYTHGVWPREIDHADRNRSNNAMSNLREATHSQNGMNTPLRSMNTSGYRGVTWNKKTRKWQAQAKVNGRNHYLGQFDSAREASNVFKAFCMEHHGQFFAKDQMVAA